MPFENPGFSAFVLWLGLNTLLMLVLALNVTRMRFKVGAEPSAEPALERAIRAHGNNIEYVPIIMIGIGVLAVIGYGATWIHTLGGVLLLGRLAHAHGIQQDSGGIPPTRVAGNFMTWVVMLVVSIALVLAFL